MGERQYLRIISSDSRIRVSFIVEKVKNFVTQYELLIKKEWHPVIRYDTAHSFVHIERRFKNEKK